VLFVGDDWAEDHHDVEIQDETGVKLATARLPEGVEGIARLHALIARYGGERVEPARVVVGIETDRGPWVQALVGSGYRVFGINPRQAARFKERYTTSGAKSDKGDAHALADMVRIDRAQLRAIAGDSEQAQAVKVVARAHQTLIWERTRTMMRLRIALREYFPAALVAYADLTLSGADTLELLRLAPDPQTAAELTRAQITAALKRARRRGIDDKVTAIADALRTGHLGQPERVTDAYAATVRAHAGVITALNEQISQLEKQVKTHFRGHPDAEIYRSVPGIGDLTGARVLAEFGDDPARYASAKARKNYAGTSPITRASGKATSSLPATSATTGSPTPSTPKHSQHSPDHPAPAPTTTGNEPAGSATTPRSANSATASSASSTDASKPAPSTTKQPPGHTTLKPSPLDTKQHGVSSARSGGWA